MVSLTRNIRSPTGGATFFSDSVNMDEDSATLMPILESFGVFKPLRTAPYFGIHLFATIAVEVSTITLALLNLGDKHQCVTYYFIVLYMHTGLWFLTLIVDYIARRKHRALRLNGYLKFYDDTRNYYRLPFYIVSIWTALILLLQTFLQQMYVDDFLDHCVKSNWDTPITYVCIVIAVELFLIFGIDVGYIYKVLEFNRIKPVPDVQREEYQSAYTFDPNSEFSQEKILDFLQMQADLIWYFREHNNRLSEKLMVLNAQRQALRTNN